ncbi:unnamed protein product [Didymodactylos carnosus]|uniref:Protein kinase domain-containing protein n=1 Tax=Didymodactylos carnosus TaxID=1234261 RepID=A0A8S2R3V2_9BILA|nr:unnamed protein product [Didymodactylos carnosus]CAF4144403.1 unnamed protein product [Didymodactylos carnosus]
MVKTAWFSLIPIKNYSKNSHGHYILATIVVTIFPFKSIGFLFYLGRGASGMVYQTEYQNIQYAIKISNKNSIKEYEIAEEMKSDINEHILDVKIMNMFSVQSFILSRPVGQIVKKDQIRQKRYITQQLAIGHKLGHVPRDIRMYNLILFNYEYSSRGQKVSAYYADDCVSVTYMLLLSFCTKEEENSLKECARDSLAGRLIVKRPEFLRVHPKEVIDSLYDIERERVSLMNIDDLHN